MHFWLKLTGMINFLLGGLLAVGAIVFLIRENVFASIGLGIGAIAFFLVGIIMFGVSWLIRTRTLSGKRVLATGLPATAVIKSVSDAGVTLQFGMYAIFDFDLEVHPEGASPYWVSCRSLVPRTAFGTVGIGKTVAVRVDPQDPNLVAIDWSMAVPQPSGGV
jgi:hypothetical protein